MTIEWRVACLVLPLAMLLGMGCDKGASGSEGGAEHAVQAETEPGAPEGASPEATAPTGDDAGPAGDPDTPTDNRFIGHWRVEGTNVTAVYNSNMRLRMDLGGGAGCLGTYEIEGDRLRLDYDDGQTTCMDGAMNFSFSDDGNTLRFGVAATYVRVNALDDTSF
jgi:hypothetical protein